MGTAALWFDTGSRNCSVTDSVFEDTSGSALMIGGIQDRLQPDPALWTAAVTLTNSRITQAAAEYHDSPAVLIGWSADTTVSHCEIANVSYSGVSLGWGKQPVQQAPLLTGPLSHTNGAAFAGWGDQSYSRNNIIDHNEIHHVMCGDLVDGGSIYSLGHNPGGGYTHNYIHHQCR